MEINMSKVKILFLSAAPEDEEDINVDREFRQINEGIQKGSCKILLEFVPEWNIRPDQLIEKLQIHDPDIFHFSGHGKKEGILLENKNGGAELVDGDLLIDVFRALKNNKIKLVVLNTCNANKQAKAIAKNIGCAAIGMSSNIDDSIAIRFSASFYRNIAFGYSITQAFDISKLNLKLVKTDQSDIAQLYHGNINADQVFLSKRKGELLISDYEIWGNYVTFLEFSKLIHHVFQTIGIQHLQEINIKIDKIQEKTPNLEKIRFSRSWENYKNEFNRLFVDDFKAKFSNYETDIKEIFIVLERINDITMQKKIKVLYPFYKNIEDLLKSYTSNHDMVIIDANKKGDAALYSQDNKQRILDLSETAHNLTTTSDDLLKRLIEIIL